MPLFDEVKRAGLADMATLAQLDPELQPLMMPSLMEELGWGDAGLAMLSLARDFAKIAAYAKVHSTETAYELAQEAMRLFGGNGLTLEYPIEKLLRDCQRVVDRRRREQRSGAQRGEHAQPATSPQCGQPPDGRQCTVGAAPAARRR